MLSQADILVTEEPVFADPVDEKEIWFTVQPLAVPPEELFPLILITPDISPTLVNCPNKTL